MARLFGRILSSIWDDEDFLDLTRSEQGLYMFLCSQPNLNHAGLLPLTFRRWSDSARDLTAEDIRRDLIALEAKRFVVLDFEKEEVLVRSLLRRDDVWKAPRVMGAAVSNAMEIRSRKLRAALLAEVGRLPLDELSDKPTKDNGPSIRQQVEEHIANLRRSFGPLPVPPEPPREPLPDEGGDLLVLPLAEGVAEGDYVRERGIAGARNALTPSPALDGLSNPSPTAPGDDGALFGIEGAAGKPQPNAKGAKSKASQSKKAEKSAESSRGTRIPADFDITESMRQWGEKNAPHVNGRLATDEFVDYWIALPGSRALKLDWVRTWQGRMRELERRALERLERTQARTAVIPAQRPSATAQRTQTGMDLIQQFAAEEGVDLATVIPINQRRGISA